MVPVVLIRPILLPRISAKYKAPSGPEVIPLGAGKSEVRGNSVIVCAATLADQPTQVTAAKHNLAADPPRLK